MADATKVISFLLSEKTHKQEMMSAMTDATNLILFLLSQTNVENSCTKPVEISRHAEKNLIVSHHVIFWRCHCVVKKLLRWHIVLSMQLYLNGIALVICNCNEPMVTATESQHDMIFNLSKA